MTTLTPERLEQIEKRWSLYMDERLTNTARQYHKDYAADYIPDLLGEIKRLREELAECQLQRELFHQGNQGLVAQLSDARAALRVKDEALNAVAAQLSCPARNTTSSHRRDGSVIISDDVRTMVQSAALQPGRE
jgi:hypothetical protein